MLNTALHNPNVKHRITVDEFVKQNRGINSGKDLPKDMLVRMLKDIPTTTYRIITGLSFLYN